MATVKVKYCCDECGTLHDYECDASECCAPEVSEVYLCSVCGAKFDVEYEAQEHCAHEHDADEPDAPTHAELEAHGQQRLPL